MLCEQIKDRRIVVRVDASNVIGLGHFMRCLALADAVRTYGANTFFLSRDLPASCISMLKANGHVHLGIGTQRSNDYKVTDALTNNEYADWLAVSQEKDAIDSIRTIEGTSPDWLIVDHYALDAVWEDALSAHCKRLMVIDDLANRPHKCDLLLDQNLGRNRDDYMPLLSASTDVMIGPDFSMLRPEFTQYRNVSLAMRDARKTKCILISMGGADYENVTGDVLEALIEARISTSFKLKIVLGHQNKWVTEVSKLAERLGTQASVYVGVNNMAQLMADCDLAIGGAGGSAWERCCLGLPSILIVLAENQREGAAALQAAGAAITSSCIHQVPGLIERLFADFQPNSEIERMSFSARHLVDGLGLDRVLRRMFEDGTL